jgi:type I restriction enzyme M protein
MTTIPQNRDVTDVMIALIPEDGSRLANRELRAAIDSELGIALSDEQFNAAKDVVVGMGLAEKVKGPGGGLRAVDSKQVQKNPVATSTMRPDGALTLSQLAQHLWEAANILRGSPVDRTDWKSYILPLLFFKRICDQWDEEHVAMIAEYGEDFADEHRFQLPEGAHWNDVRATPKNVGTALSNAMRAVEAANQKHLYGVFGDAQWTNKDRLPDELLKDLIEHFSSLAIGNASVASDVMGDAYEYLIKQFADATNKKAGEFYTPRSVVRLMVDIVDPQEGETVYDPACGTGGMLLAAVEHVRARGGDPRTFFGRIYGQEKNLTTAAAARMNLFLHGLEDFVIERGDTLRNPVFTNPASGGLAQFDVVIANPPFSLKQWGREVWETDPWGRTLAAVPPDSNGDFAWVQHMIASMASTTGRAAIILPIGAMIRRGVERDIRQYLVKNDLVEAVIGLPSDLFYGTVVEAVILVLVQAKRKESKGRVLFIDGADLGRRGRGSVTLEDDDRAVLLGELEQQTASQGRSAVVTTKTIAARDWAMAPKIYVEPRLHVDTKTLPEAAKWFRQLLLKARDSEDAAIATLSSSELLP